MRQKLLKTLAKPHIALALEGHLESAPFDMEGFHCQTFELGTIGEYQTYLVLGYNDSEIMVAFGMANDDGELCMTPHVTFIFKDLVGVDRAIMKIYHSFNCHIPDPTVPEMPQK